MDNNKNTNTLKTWRPCLLLLLLGLISILSGIAQAVAINQGGSEQHYQSMPLPIVIHIIAGVLFNLLSPLQFAPAIRNKMPKIHQWTGRLLVLCAIAVGFSSLWMNHFFPSYGGFIKYSGIVAYNLVLLGGMFMAIKAVISGDINTHQAWMMRAMAAALGPATQRLIAIPLFAIFGQGVFSELAVGLLIWFGLLVNLTFVEWKLRKQPKNNIAKSQVIQSA